MKPYGTGLIGISNGGIYKEPDVSEEDDKMYLNGLRLVLHALALKLGIFMMTFAESNMSLYYLKVHYNVFGETPKNLLASQLLEADAYRYGYCGDSHKIS